MAILNLLAIFDAVIIYSSLYVISITVFYSEAFNIFLWKASMISGFSSLILTSLIYTFLKEYKKIPDFPFLYFVTLLGIFIGSLFLPNSIDITINVLKTPPFILFDLTQINYSFNLFSGLIVIIFQGSIIVYYFYLSFTINKKARNRDITKSLINNTIIFSLPILLYIMYIILRFPIFRELHILTLWISVLGNCIMLLKKPEMFLELTNKIYYINIYHKSGILLYSYDFNQSEAEMDPAIWGNILIGLNHILSEFVDTQNQIDVFQTRNTDIIVNYDEIGFAVVLITNRKNSILKNLMENFSLEFRNKYDNELTEIQDLNRLINVSEFTETKELVEKEFKLYLGF
jgi:hypothetical protein